jgi:hypothetical protein
MEKNMPFVGRTDTSELGLSIAPVGVCYFPWPPATVLCIPWDEIHVLRLLLIDRRIPTTYRSNGNTLLDMISQRDVWSASALRDNIITGGKHMGLSCGEEVPWNHYDPQNEGLSKNITLQMTMKLNVRKPYFCAVVPAYAAERPG